MVTPKRSVSAPDSLNNNLYLASLGSEMSYFFLRRVKGLPVPKDDFLLDAAKYLSTARKGNEVMGVWTTGGNVPILQEVQEGLEAYQEVSFLFGGEWDEDNTKICVQTEVLGVTTLPQAGPEDYLPLLPFALIGITGVAMLFKQK